jgi:hypothetical protein
MIICDNWLAFLCWAKHIVKKGDACGIIMGELNQVEYGIKGFPHRHMIEFDDQYCEVYKHQGISLLLQDGT